MQNSRKKEALGFPNFYEWFSPVSPISIGMGLRSSALRAGEAPLQKDICSFPGNHGYWVYHELTKAMIVSVLQKGS